MTDMYKPDLVSEYTTPRARETHEYYEQSLYRDKELAAFIEAVCKALGGVSYHNTNHEIATIYRPGDIHAMGEIGFRDIRIKVSGAAVKQYYVRSNTIESSKYKSGWRHSMLSTKSMTAAVKYAVEHIKPTTALVSLKLTIDDAVRPIEGDITELNSTARTHFRKLTGESGYGNSYKTMLFRELRNITFLSPELNHTVAEFYKAVDEEQAAKDLFSSPMHFVGLSDNYGQLVADIAKCKVGYGQRAELTTPTRMPATELPEWIQGRISVLQMVAPETYVRGVGVRLDDKVFYTTGRLTSEMVIKSAQMGVPVLVSRSGITQMGLDVAQRIGLCTIGRATHKRFLCFSAPERLVWQPEPASSLG